MDDTSVNSETAVEEHAHKEPDVTSSDPNERKLARRLRIQRRIEAARRQLVDGSDAALIKDETLTDKGLLDKQIIASTLLLQKLEKEGDELVTNIRVANDSREVDRREAEGISREKIIKHLSEEAEAAEVMFLNVNQKWANILEYHDPLNIHDAMKEQQQSANALLRQKDSIIEMLKEELKNAEEKFTLDQNIQDDDIKILTSRIEKQVILIREAYRQELHLIENVIGQERQLLKEVCDKKWEELYKQRDAMEEENWEVKEKMMEEFLQHLRDKRIQFQETFRENKISLETDIQTLQKELQIMKQTTLMNTERMDYNYQILKKREDENIIINSQQKRKINKLQDVINALKKKIKEYQTYSQNEIVRMTADIQKFRNQISANEKKSRLFTEINDTKFMQIWELNTNKAVELLNKILTTDEILCAQQLGIPYQKPEKRLLRIEDLTSYKEAQVIVSKQMFAKKSSCMSKLSSKMDKKSSAVSKGHHQDEEGQTNAMHQKLMKHVMENIALKGNFLLESQLNQVLEPYMYEESVLVRLDNVFFALNINDTAAIDMLLQFFLPYTHCLVCNESHSEQESIEETSITSMKVSQQISDANEQDVVEIDMLGVNEALVAVQQPEQVINDALLSLVDAPEKSEKALTSAMRSRTISAINKKAFSYSKHQAISVTSVPHAESFACQYLHPLVISPVYVLRALREFVSNVFDNKKTAADLSKGAKAKETISRLMSNEDIIMYWERFRLIFSSERECLWDGLLAGLKKYHNILKDRRKIYQEIVDMQKKNEELRKILDNYEKAQENNTMFPAPCPDKRFFKYEKKKPKNERIKLPKLPKLNL